jgi:hypothetical protein
MEKVSRARQERINRLKAMAEKMPDSLFRSAKGKAGIQKKEFYDRIPDLTQMFSSPPPSDSAGERERFLAAFRKHAADHPGAYIDVISAMPSPLADSGTNWLQRIVDDHCHKASAILPSLEMIFEKSSS